jgi:gliding motility-associated-like protein
MKLKGIVKILCWWMLLGIAKQLPAQLNSYNMGTYTVTDCRAKFYDNGGPSADYISLPPTGSSNTFVITTGNPLITMTFNPSQLQTKIQISDVISFYKQFPLIPANLIAGPYTNVPITTTISPVTSNTGTLIVVFTEDGSGGGAGWDAGWYSQAPPPPTPATTLAVVPTCSASVIQMTTTAPILCASLTNNYFNITGPIFPVIFTVQPVGCNNGTCTAYNITLNSPGVNSNCNYTISSTLFAKDKCDSVYMYPNLISTFSISSCPITGSISVPVTNTVCAYSCTSNVTAIVPASVCLSLNYTWNNGLPPSPGPHAICPTVTTVYNCTVAVSSTPSNSVVLTRTVFVVDPQINALPSNTICQSSPWFNFGGTPSGGVWLGPGINNSVTGQYCTGCVGPGVKTITYQVGNCFATTTIMIIAINAGSDDAACVGGPTFVVSGGTPLGGTWSGAGNISPGGVFTPTLIGDFLVTYSVANCAQSKSVHVASGVSVSPNFTVCQSEWYEYFVNRPGFSPPGGRFYGPGILNTVVGTFSPTTAGPGNHVITYSLASGCFATFTVTVLPINVSPITATTCPSFGAFLLSGIPSTATPAGGTWSCSVPGAIQNAATGMYNPGAGGANTHTDIVVYKALNGCTDTIEMRSIRTNIVLDSMFFCLTSPAQQLSNFAAFTYSPAGGVYSGPGVTFSSGNYFFTPAVAGVGIHTVTYTVNGCTPDSIKMIVYPNVATLTASNSVLCSSHPTVFLVNPNLPFGTTWFGPGIITASTGVFDPSAVTPNSTVVLTYTNRGGCSNTVSLSVYQFVAANITGLSPTFCYQNTTYTFFTVPPNGTLTTIGTTLTPNIFNPTVVGAGQYTLTYEFGIGACSTSTSIVVKVWPQLTTTATISNPTICIGESSKLTVKGGGGLPTVTQYTYTWSNNLIPISSHNVVPSATTVYTCVTSDGCSDPKVDLFMVTVHPNYYTSFTTPSIQCYGVAAQVTANITPSTGPYTYTWSTVPVQNTATLSGFAGKNYLLSVKNTSTGCIKDTSIVVPGWPVIKALFSPEPNLSCIPFEDNLVSFLDLSNGAISGVWTFNGSTQSYTPGVTVTNEFKGPGSYNVTLDVVNQGNCPSSYAWSICILESTEIFLPDIFSPNKDGSNDVLYVRGNGIKEMKFQVYDRWGNKVFESGDTKSGWDGTYNGKDAEPGVYAYYLDATLFTDKKIIKKGDITLVR